MPEPFIFEARIRFVDTDASGRIHYTSLFRFFESAETELFRTFDVSYSRGAYLFPRVHAECDIQRALHHDDLLQIEVSLTKLGKSSLRFEFRALKNGEVAATGAVVIVCMDRQSQRAVPIPDDLRSKLSAIAIPGQSPLLPCSVFRVPRVPEQSP
jgi:YbgC/YbaW family acyl-CoA thioester hydrolase